MTIGENNLIIQIFSMIKKIKFTPNNIITLLVFGLLLIAYSCTSSHLARGKQFYKEGEIINAMDELEQAVYTKEGDYWHQIESHCALAKAYISANRIRDAALTYKDAFYIVKNKMDEINDAQRERIRSSGSVSGTLEMMRKRGKLDREYLKLKSKAQDIKEQLMQLE